MFPTSIWALGLVASVLIGGGISLLCGHGKKGVIGGILFCAGVYCVITALALFLSK